MGKKTKQVFHNQAREVILRAVTRIYDAVRLTMGPSGGNALMYGVFGRSHRITNDGVTVAGVIEPKNEWEGLVVSAVQDAAKRTNEQAGDATTCTVVLLGRLVRSIFADLSALSSFAGTGGTSVMKIRNELLEAGKQVEEKIAEAARKVESLEDLKKVATISTESAELGDLVADMSWKVGVDGFILVNEGFGGKITSEIIEGARFPAKVPGKGFINNPARMEMVAKDVAVLLTNYELRNPRELAQAINPLLKNNPKLAVLAPEFSQEVLADLWKANYKLLGGGAIEKTGIEIYPIKTPSLRTEQWEDLEVYFGAKFIDKKKDQKLLGIDESALGFAESITVKDSAVREDAVALGGKGARVSEIQGMPVASLVQERIKNLKAQIEIEKEEQDKNLLRQRIASLGSAVGVIRVSADSDSETYYLKKKIEDGVYSCRSALEEGWVKGGGLCLKEIADEIDNKYLKDALRAPYEQIQENAEEELKIGDDVIDAAKAIRLAVKHAVSAAASLATVKVIIAEERDKQPWEAHEYVGDAILQFARYWAKREGILDENKQEIERDRMWKEDRILRETPD